MTCRHRSGDPDCSSYRGPQEEIRILQERIAEQSRLLKDPDNTQFDIIDYLELPQGIVLRVKYDSCPGCSYEGVKVLVYRGFSIANTLRWRVIDPHFSDKARGPREAPSPTARFPASDQGWEDARRFLLSEG